MSSHTCRGWSLSSNGRPTTRIGRWTPTSTTQYMACCIVLHKNTRKNSFQAHQQDSCTLRGSCASQAIWSRTASPRRRTCRCAPRRSGPAFDTVAFTTIGVESVFRDLRFAIKHMASVSRLIIGQVGKYTAVLWHSPFMGRSAAYKLHRRCMKASAAM